MNVVHGLIINIMIKSNVKMGLRLSFAVIQSRFTIDYNILSIVKWPSSSTDVGWMSQFTEFLVILF